MPTHFMISGQLRFRSEEMIENEIDDIGFRVNGEEFWELDDVSEVDFEPLFREFKVWIPYRVFEESNEISEERPNDSRTFYKK